MAVVSIGVLGVFRLLEGAFLHGVFDLGLVVAVAAMARLAVIDKYLNLASRVAALLYVVGTWAVINIAGDPALYWSFVAVLATFFAIRAKEATLASAVTFLVIVYSVFDDLSFEVKIGFSACFWLTTLFSYYFSERLWSDNQKLEKQALHDRLTGLMNRRSYDDAMSRALVALKRDGSECCLFVIDVDHFKRINDDFGHAVGDLTLARMAGVIRELFPDTAKIFRYGGEEFVALVPLGLEEARQLGDCVRENIAERKLVRRLKAAVTISVGIAEFYLSDDSRSWFQRADAALYQAKASGRNMVVAKPAPEARLNSED
jgi:diguanylate cyclase (GGDEF)-like protein